MTHPGRIDRLPGCPTAGPAVAVLAELVATASPATAKPRLRADVVTSAIASKAFGSTAGVPLKAVVTVRNSGKASAKSSVVGLYLSADATKSASDRRLAVGTMSALKRGKQGSTTLSTRPPSPLTAGRYSLLACADATGRVAESREPNNCRLWRTFTVVSKPPTPAPIPPSGPAGGAASACSGNLSPIAGQTGYRFSITPGTLTYTADPVGTEFASQDQYRMATFTLTNTGTVETPTFYLAPGSCYVFTGVGLDWGHLYDFSDKPLINTDCARPMKLQPGASCEGAFYADRVTVGGNQPGALELQTYNGSVLAVFPVSVGVRSRGHFSFETSDATFSPTVDTGTPMYPYVKLTNDGVRTANPAPGFSNVGAPEFSLAAGDWTAPQSGIGAIR